MQDDERQGHDRQQVDALCPECGKAFKAFVDELVKETEDPETDPKATCPVCGCGECRIGHP